MKSGFEFIDEAVYTPKKDKKDKIVLKEDLRFLNEYFHRCDHYRLKIFYR